MPRILLIHASVGGGHQRAAAALAEAFGRRQPGQVEIADVLDYTNPLFREAYARSYIQLTDKLPQLWGYMYEQADRELFRFTADVRALANQISTAGLRKLMRKFQPEVIVCTHFLPVEILSARKGRSGLNQPLYCVLTDYAAHQFWAYRNVDGYFVATDQTRDQLVTRGVPAGLIRVAGIPVDPAIARPKTVTATRAAHDLPPEGKQPVITLFGGGLQAAHVRTIITELGATGLRATLVVVAGRNGALQAELDSLTGTASLTVRVLGFISYVDDLIVASDLVITKAGGLTVSEVLARARPMIIIDPIPGQEESNADYLVGVGAALGIRLSQHVPFAVTRLFADTDRLKQMRLAAAHVARPRAALEIAEAILHDLGARQG